MADALQAHVTVAQGSPATAMVAGMTLHLFGHARETHPWPEPMFARFCRAVVEEGALFNSVASEPVLGSPSRGQIFQTTARRTEEGWLIDGRKTWATGGQHLTHMLVRASVEGRPGVLLVPQETAGIEWQPVWSDALSLRASASHDVIFHDVLVPPENLVEHGNGPGLPNVWFPMVMAGVYLGAALAARDAAIRYALERVPSSLGEPIATLPKIQQQIGRIDRALQVARSFYFEVAGEWCGHEDQRQAFNRRAAAAKTLVVATACDVTEEALRLAGGTALTHKLPFERYFRDVRAGLMQPPAEETALEMLGQAAINAFRES